MVIIERLIADERIKYLVERNFLQLSEHSQTGSRISDIDTLLVPRCKKEQIKTGFYSIIYAHNSLDDGETKEVIHRPHLSGNKMISHYKSYQ